MEVNNNPFRNASRPQNNLAESHSYGEKRGRSTRGRRGNPPSGGRGSFSGGQFRGGRGFVRGGRGFGTGGREFKRGGMGRGRGDHGGTDELTNKEKNWGKVKFNPVAATAKEEHATPWHTFKDDMVQQNVLETANPVENQEDRDFKEKCAKNNRKAHILLNQQQPTKWDDFGVAKPEDNKRKTESKKKTKNNTESKIGQVIETNKKVSSKGDELLQNFESNNLSAAQKNHLRKVITKTTHLAKGSSLKNAVEDMKRQKKLKVKKLKLKSET